MGIFIGNRNRSIDMEQIDIVKATKIFPGIEGAPVLNEYDGVDAIKNTDIFTAVSMLAGDLARMDIQIWKQGVHEENNYLEKLINVRPNDYYNGYLFKFIVFANAMLTGHGYFRIIRDTKFNPKKLVFMKTSKVNLKVDDNDTLYFEYKPNHKDVIKLDYYDVVDIKFHSLDGFKGISLLESLLKTLETDHYGRQFLGNFLKNGTHAGGILKMKGVLDNKAARDRARKSFHEQYSGTKQAGKVVVMDESMSFDQLEVDTEILKLIRDNKSSTREIAGVFGIPLHKFGIEPTNISITDANLEYLSTLAPYMKASCSALEFYFNSDLDDLVKRFRFDTSDLRVVDSETQAKIDKIDLEDGVKNLDEVRKTRGLPPIEGGFGAKHRVDLNHVNIEKVDEYQMNKSIDKKHKTNLEGGEEDEG